MFNIKTIFDETVKYISIPQSFMLQLDKNLNSSASDIRYFELCNENGKLLCYLTWSGSVSDSYAVEIPLSIIKLFDLSEDTKYIMSEIKDVRLAKEVTLSVIDDFNWLLICNSSSLIENTLLSLVNIVYKGQKLKYPITSSVSVTLSVISVSHHSVGLLDSVQGLLPEWITNKGSFIQDYDDDSGVIYGKITPNTSVSVVPPIIAPVASSDQSATVSPTNITPVITFVRRVFRVLPECYRDYSGVVPDSDLHSTNTIADNVDYDAILESLCSDDSYSASDVTKSYRVEGFASMDVTSRRIDDGVTCYLSKQSLPTAWWSSESDDAAADIIASISVEESSGETVNYIMHCYLCDNLPVDHILLPTSIRKSCGLHACCRIMLTCVPKSEWRCLKVIGWKIVTLSAHLFEIRTNIAVTKAEILNLLYSKCVSLDGQNIILCDGMVFGQYVRSVFRGITIVFNSRNMCLLSSVQALKSISSSIPVKIVTNLFNDFDLTEGMETNNFTDQLEMIPLIGPLNSTLSDIVAYISNYTCSERKVNISLVEGDVQSGKSRILLEIADKLKFSQVPIFISKIECSKLMKLPIIQQVKYIENTLHNAYSRAPCVVLIDDLEMLCGKRGKKDVRDGELNAHLSSSYLSYRFIQIVRNFIYLTSQRIDNCHCSSIVITSGDSSIYPYILRVFFESVGCKTFEINPKYTLSDLKRAFLLKAKALNASVEFEQEDIERTVRNLICWRFLEGFSVAQVCELCEKSVHECLIRRKDDGNMPIVIDMGDINNSLSKLKKSVLPSSIVGISKFTWANFTNLGGYESVKQELLSIFRTPLIYKRLYSLTTIRVPRSVLLYGMPGCGKSSLGHAIANESGLEVICIRGPELLDKYIGASEARVREIFNAARRATKPCLLLFDEFEGIGTKRGSDNTGAVDRVVNQLLTFLDGVESNIGEKSNSNKAVYVLAITSRPDMIDPALLRPGRIEKHLCIGLPTMEDCKLILISILEPLLLGGGIKIEKSDLLSLVDKLSEVSVTKSFTVADLEGCVKKAYIDYVYSSLPSQKLGSSVDVTSGGKEVEFITYLEKSFASCRAMLNSEDILSYQKLFARFSGEKTALISHTCKTALM